MAWFPVIRSLCTNRAFFQVKTYTADEPQPLALTEVLPSVGPRPIAVKLILTGRRLVEFRQWSINQLQLARDSH